MLFRLLSNLGSSDPPVLDFQVAEGTACIIMLDFLIVGGLKNYDEGFFCFVCISISNCVSAQLDKRLSFRSRKNCFFVFVIKSVDQAGHGNTYL